MEYGRSWGRVVSVEQALAARAQKIRIAAPAGTGKTEFIVRKAAQLASQGFDPEKILCVVATPAAAHRMRERLGHAGEPLKRSAVLTPFESAMRVLGHSGARAVTGRGARVLLRVERDVLLEDVEAAVGSADAVRSLLPKMRTGLDSLAEPLGWGLTDPERAAYDALLERLRFLGAVLPEEVPALAASFLSSEASEQGAYQAVLVDDAHCLGHAYLETFSLLASAVLVACGNPCESLAGTAADSPGNAFESFGADAERFVFTYTNQPASIAAFCNALRQRAGDGPLLASANAADENSTRRTPLACVKWKEPKDEFRGVSDLVRAILREHDDIGAGDVFVAVPNGYWARGVAKRLENCGVDCVAAMGVDPVVGDPRRDRSGTLEAYCALALAADADDASAWRLWCAFGDGDCLVETWASFEAWALSSGLGAVAALRELDDRADADPFPGASRLRNRYRAGLEARRSLTGKRGFALAKELMRFSGGKQLKSFLGPLEGDESVPELKRRLAVRSLEPGFVPDRRKVVVGLSKLARGLNPRIVVCCGLVEGMVPFACDAKFAKDASADGARLGAERCKFCEMAGKARESLVLSSVQFADPSLAEKFRICAHRTKNYHGRKVAVLERSRFIDEAGDCAPVCASGEQFLSQLASREKLHDSRGKAEPVQRIMEEGVGHAGR